MLESSEPESEDYIATSAGHASITRTLDSPSASVDVSLAGKVQTQTEALSTAAAELYPSLALCEVALRSAATNGGFDVVKSRSKADKKGSIRKVWFSCIHGGTYANRRYYLNDDTRRRKTSTSKLGCEWSAIATRTKIGEIESWAIEVVESVHSHPKTEELSAYPSIRRLTADEMATVSRLSDAGAAPRTISASIYSSRIATGHLTAALGQDVYNVRKRRRSGELQGRSPVEALLDELEEKGI